MTFIHPNCSLKNWLVYKQAQSFLYKFKNRYGKVLYDLGCGEMPYKDFFLQFLCKKSLHNLPKPNYLSNLAYLFRNKEL